MRRDLIPAFVLWEHRSKKTGEVYYSGKLGEATLLIFHERAKLSEKGPDLRAYFAPPEKKEEEKSA